MIPFCDNCGECCRKYHISASPFDVIRWRREYEYEILDQLFGYAGKLLIRDLFFDDDYNNGEESPDGQVPCIHRVNNCCDIHHTKPEMCANFLCEKAKRRQREFFKNRRDRKRHRRDG